MRSTVTSVITASIGAASAPVRGDADITRVIAAADQALYQAKAQGRNRTVVAGPDTHVPPRPQPRTAAAVTPGP